MIFGGWFRSSFDVFPRPQAIVRWNIRLFGIGLGDDDKRISAVDANCIALAAVLDHGALRTTAGVRDVPGNIRDSRRRHQESRA
jgi:hypothetical protein